MVKTASHEDIAHVPGKAHLNKTRKGYMEHTSIHAQFSGAQVSTALHRSTTSANGKLPLFGTLYCQVHVGLVDQDSSANSARFQLLLVKWQNVFKTAGIVISIYPA